MPFIRRIGIELEGGWENHPPTRIHPDGSVSVAANYVGEVSSNPLLRADVADWVRANYPTATNESCGLHVHTSLCNLGRYSQLMRPAFFDYWTRHMTAFGKRYPIKSDAFWYRMNGHNSYCEKTWNPDEQARETGKGGVRYTQLNFCHALHGTLEARVLPMFKYPETALAAINAHLDIIESYLSTQTLTRLIAAEREEVQESFPDLDYSCGTWTVSVGKDLVESESETVEIQIEAEEKIQCAL